MKPPDLFLPIEIDGHEKLALVELPESHGGLQNAPVYPIAFRTSVVPARLATAIGSTIADGSRSGYRLRTTNSLCGDLPFSILPA